jgi:hypothetical protein
VPCGGTFWLAAPAMQPPLSLFLATVLQSEWFTERRPVALLSGSLVLPHWSEHPREVAFVLAVHNCGWRGL